jgi:drug/metabolite transporter (DMT)-like permease
MSPGYWFMFGALLSFAGMGVVHKLGDKLHANPINIALLTMAAGFVVTLIRSGLSGPGLHNIPPHIAFVAIPFGISAAIALWLFQKGLRHGHIVTSWLIINLSTAIPTVLSIVVYHEALNPRKLFTLVLIAASLVLLWWDRVRLTENASRKL